MGKVVLRAEIRTGIMYSEGYICIDGNQIQGVFGRDYIIFSFKNNFLYAEMYERIYDSDIKDEIISVYNYTSNKLYTNELCCPEQYLLFKERDGMSLNLTKKETDKKKIEMIFEELKKVKQEVYF